MKQVQLLAASIAAVAAIAGATVAVTSQPFEERSTAASPLAPTGIEESRDRASSHRFTRSGQINDSSPQLQPAVKDRGDRPATGSSSSNPQLTPTAPSRPRVEAYPRQPLTLTDEAVPSSDFFQFRAQLRQAVADRDADFIRAIASPQIRLSFGDVQTLDSLNLDDPDAPAWRHLEKAIATGCATYDLARPDTDMGTLTWVCPQAFVTPEIDSPYNQVVIVAADVNVRDEPSLNSPVVDVVSSEIVQRDLQVELASAEYDLAETLEGWVPVVTPRGIRGYVSSRYAYSPVGYRAFFSRTNGDWQMEMFLAGD